MCKDDKRSRAGCIANLCHISSPRWVSSELEPIFGKCTPGRNRLDPVLAETVVTVGAILMTHSYVEQRSTAVLPRLIAWGAAAMMLVSLAGHADAAPPNLATVEKVVTKYFAHKPNYQPGDLISRADAEAIFARLLELGYEPADRERLYDPFLPHNSFLVSELSTPDGMRFMRKVSKYPNVYDRLERLSWIPAGRELIRELIQSPEGPEVVRSLTTAEGAKAVEKILAGDDRAANFGLPTGHIHTAEQLLEELRGSHASAATPVTKSRKG